MPPSSSHSTVAPRLRVADELADAAPGSREHDVCGATATEVSALREGGVLRDGAGLIAHDERSRHVLAQACKVAESSVPVLLCGESGTGKELLARLIHARSARRHGPFETVDCASLSPSLVASELFGHERGAFTGADRQHIGAFERAHGGTLFLDEIGDLPEALQPTLLGALERRRFRRLGSRNEVEVDVRIVSATHRQLRSEVRTRRFRLDLYFRLAVVRIAVPALRERPEDLPALISCFARSADATDEQLASLLDEPVFEALRAHDWPGNVRELKNFVHATIAMGEPPPLDPHEGPSEASEDFTVALGPVAALPYKDARAHVVREFEKAYLPLALSRAAGNVSRAAREVGMDRSHLWELLRRHGLR